ncbi:MAG: tetratricopeptide repeat protein [Magnetococcales bacterium]|nr:tetratricopeptide repeat protein [Magnetococcales bacterium]
MSDNVAIQESELPGSQLESVFLSEKEETFPDALNSTDTPSVAIRPAKVGAANPWFGSSPDRPSVEEYGENDDWQSHHPLKGVRALVSLLGGGGENTAESHYVVEPEVEAQPIIKKNIEQHQGLSHEEQQWNNRLVRTDSLLDALMRKKTGRVRPVKRQKSKQEPIDTPKGKQAQQEPIEIQPEPIQISEAGVADQLKAKVAVRVVGKKKLINPAMIKKLPVYDGVLEKIEPNLVSKEVKPAPEIKKTEEKHSSLEVRLASFDGNTEREHVFQENKHTPVVEKNEQKQPLPEVKLALVPDAIEPEQVSTKIKPAAVIAKTDLNPVAQKKPESFANVAWLHDNEQEIKEIDGNSIHTKQPLKQDEVSIHNLIENSVVVDQDREKKEVDDSQSVTVKTERQISTELPLVKEDVISGIEVKKIAEPLDKKKFKIELPIQHQKKQKNSGTALSLNSRRVQDRGSNEMGFYFFAIRNILQRISNTAIKRFLSTFMIDGELQYQYYLERGDFFSKKGDNRRAARYYEKALLHRPGEKEIMGRLGLCYLKTGLLKDGIDYLEKLESNGQARPGLDKKLAIAYIRLEEYGKAVEKLGKALLTSPDDFELNYCLATVLDQLGDHQKAVESFNKALAIDPNSVKANRNLGFCFEQSGESGKAVKYFKRAAELEEISVVDFGGVE